MASSIHDSMLTASVSALGITRLLRNLGVFCRTEDVPLVDAKLTVITKLILRVHLEAVDMDGMPIRSTRAEVAFRFGGMLLPVVWQPGSNDYVAEVAAALTDAAGCTTLLSPQRMHGGPPPGTRRQHASSCGAESKS
jgi:hypothetical protein